MKPSEVNPRKLPPAIAPTQTLTPGQKALRTILGRYLKKHGTEEQIRLLSPFAIFETPLTGNQQENPSEPRE